MDDVDISNEQESFLLDLATAKIRNAKTQLQPTGYCRYCHEPTNSVFCSQDCRDDYEWVQKCKSRS